MYTLPYLTRSASREAHANRIAIPRTKLSHVACIVLAAVSAPSQAQTPPNFEAPRIFYTSGVSELDPASDPFGLALGDIDGDADLDLVVSCQRQPISIKVYRNSGVWIGGSGFFTPAPRYNMGANFPGEVALGNLNGDSFPDVAVASDPIVTLRFNDGAGGFGNPVGGFLTVVHNVLGATGIFIADWDNDSRQDIAIGGYISDAGVNRPALSILWRETNFPGFTNQVYVAGGEEGLGSDIESWYELRSGPPGGAFAPPTVPNTIVLSNRTNGRLHAFLYNGNRTFTNLNGAGVASQVLTAAPLNTGPSIDPACTDAPLAATRWYSNSFNGNFGLNQFSYPVDTGPLGIDAGRLNQNDTRYDLAVANRLGASGTGNLSILVNTGSVNNLFQRFDFAILPVGHTAFPQHVIVGDVTGDGVDDIITANAGQIGVIDADESIAVFRQLAQGP